MAKVDFKVPEEFLSQLSKLGGNFDAVAERVLQAGGEVVLRKVKSGLSAVIGQDLKYEPRSTGELERSLGLSPALLDKEGNHNIKIGFSEPRSDGSSNAQIANIIEYGKHGMPPKPFLKPAKKSAKKECLAAMQAKFDEEVAKL